MEQLIEELTEQFKESIPKEEETLCVAFKEYLLIAKESLESSNSKFISKDEKSIINVLKSMASRLTGEELLVKKKELLIDKKYENLKALSLYINDVAKEVLGGKNPKLNFDINRKIEEITNLLELVEDYNKEDAKYLVSETILDLKFIENPQTNIMSLRLGRTMQNLNRQNKN